MPKFLATIMIETDDTAPDFKDSTHEELCIKLFEEFVLDTPKYCVTNLFDIQELPVDD